MYATPWEDPRTLSFAVLSAMIGLIAFCGSYAYNVWRRRNASASVHGRRWTAAVRGASLATLFAGTLALVAAAAVREVFPPVGSIVGDQLFTVRARDGFDVEYVADGPQVARGDLIVRFQSPQLAAESAELSARIGELRAERNTAEIAALDLDADLVRRHQAAMSRLQQFRASRDQMLPVRETIAQRRVESWLDRGDKLSHLEDERRAVLGDAKVALVREGLGKVNLRRLEQLGRKSIVAPGQLDEARAELAGVQMEIAKLNARTEALAKEAKEVESSRLKLDAECERQLKHFAAELAQIETAIAEATADERRWAESIAADRRRAKQLRAHELARLDAKIEQSRAKHAGARQTLEIKAPFSGKVIYGARSPNTLDQRDALLVLGREDGVVMRLRMPRTQIAALQSAGTIEAKLDRPALVPTFTARYLRHAAIGDGDEQGIVELSCDLPAESARDLVQGGQLVAHLCWRPPLWTISPFGFGGALILLGSLGCVIAARFRREGQIPDMVPAATNGHGHASFETSPHKGRDAAGDLEFGELAASLRMLADRFRASLIQRRLDADLIGAVEWALDRHQARAVRLMTECLAEDDQFAESARHLLDGNAANGNGQMGHSLDARLRRRVARIVSAIAPSLSNGDARIHCII